MQASENNSSSEEEFDANQICVYKSSSSQTDKITTVLTVDGIEVEMELDTGAELSTIPIAVYRQMLHQYDGTMLPTKGEIEVVVSTGQQTSTGKFIIVDIANDQLPW